VSRRILFMLLAFTAAVLVGAVVPLTLNATSHDRNSFSQAAAGMARTDAVIAQSYLNTQATPSQPAPKKGKPKQSKPSTTAQGKLPLVTVAKETREAGYGLLVLGHRNQYRDKQGRIVPASNPVASNP
jgi:hypothetical protein